jgi:hypothetical protein
MEKEHMLLKKVGVRPTAEPLGAMHKLLEEQDEAVDKVLGKHRKFMEFAKNSPPCPECCGINFDARETC